MTNCARCGRLVEPGAQFCPSCGAQLSMVASSVAGKAAGLKAQGYSSTCPTPYYPRARGKCELLDE